MKRLLIMTVGKTHSGKSTFAQTMALNLPNTAVIDQDNQAEFLHAHYQALLPERGPNRIKYALTQTLIEHAADATDCHVVLCNANLEKNSRQELLSFFKEKGFVCILVSFELPIELLADRISASKRSQSILRSAASFEEVLDRQERANGELPKASEADHLFIIKTEEAMKDVVREIFLLAHRK